MDVETVDVKKMYKCRYCGEKHGYGCEKLFKDNILTYEHERIIQHHNAVVKNLCLLFCAVGMSPSENSSCPRECKLQCNLRCKYNFKENCEHYCKCEHKCECILRCKCRQQHSSIMSYIQETFPFGKLLLMAFSQPEDTYGKKNYKYKDMTARLEKGDCGALLSLLSAFNTNIITNTKQDIGVFEWKIRIKDTEYKLDVPYPLTVGNYCRLMSQCIAHNQ